MTEFEQQDVNHGRAQAMVTAPSEFIATGLFSEYGALPLLLVESEIGTDGRNVGVACATAAHVSVASDAAAAVRRRATQPDRTTADRLVGKRPTRP
jgi:hypothetical protein